jgi:hypothetical protein
VKNNVKQRRNRTGGFGEPAQPVTASDSEVRHCSAEKTMVEEVNLTEDIRKLLFRQALSVPSPWYVVIDAAQDAELPAQAVKMGLRTRSLYAGRLGALLDHVAPHLAALELSSAFATHLLERWELPCGILLQSRAPFEELRKHLRQFLMVRDEGGTRYRFRFYDPRVLRAFLPACTADEAREFFGPVERLYCASRDGSSVLAFSLRETGVRVTRLTVEPALD